MDASTERLAQYVRTGSRAALDDLIRQHVDFVYACALRQVRDTHMAQDITQAVFIVLTRRARTIKSESALAGWLFKTARYAAANALKVERRRRRHEQAAAAQRPESIMASSDLSESETLIQLLDSAIASLNSSDRDVILCRYLQGREMSEVGAALGVSESTARKRVGRAVERLRKEFARQGVAVGSEIVGTTLTTAGAQAAPAGMAGAVSTAASGVASPTVAAVAHELQRIIGWYKAKAIAIVTAAALVVTGSGVLLALRPSSPATAPVAATAPAVIPVANPVALTVHCIDDAGKPIAGAQAYLAQTIYRSRNDKDVSNITLGPNLTNTTGDAQFDSVPDAGPKDLGLTRIAYARVAGKLVGFGSQMWNNKANSQKLSSSIAITLVPSVTIHGKVSVPAGFKPEMATVKTNSVFEQTAIPPMMGPELGRSSPPTIGFLADTYDPRVGPDGTFAISDIPATATSYLIANAPGLGETQKMVKDPKAVPVFDMPIESIIRGRVIRPDGKPAAGVTIEAQVLGGDPIVIRHPFSATTDADGRYAIAQLPGVTMGLRLESITDFAIDTKTIRLGTGQTVEQDLQLETGAVVSGRITDPNGKPLADTEIGGVSKLEGELGLNSTSTDTSGVYSMRLPHGQCKIYIASPSDGFTYPKNGSERTINIPPNRATMTGPGWVLPREQLRLSYSTATLTGRVIDGHGKGVAGLPIADDRVEDWGKTMMPVQDPSAAKTDADGRFTMSVQAQIEHTVLPLSADYDCPRSEKVTPLPGEKIALADLVVHGCPVVASVTGIVTDLQSKPLQYVEGYHGADKFQTDADGRFTLPVRSTTQPVVIMMSKAGYRYRGWTDIPPGSKDVRFTMVPSPDTPLDYNAKSKAPDTESLLDLPAPALHVDWVLLPQGKAPELVHNDGRKTVLVFGSDSMDPSGMQRTIAELEKLCSNCDAVPVVIFSPRATNVGVRAQFAKTTKSVSIGIDQFLADSNPNDIDGTTAMAFGARQRGAQIYIIDGDGVLVHTQKGMAGLKDALTK